jgi:hypothetical protein
MIEREEGRCSEKRSESKLLRVLPRPKPGAAQALPGLSRDRRRNRRRCLLTRQPSLRLCRHALPFFDYPAFDRCGKRFYEGHRSGTRECARLRLSQKWRRIYSKTLRARCNLREHELHSAGGNSERARGERWLLSHESWPIAPRCFGNLVNLKNSSNTVV